MSKLTKRQNYEINSWNFEIKSHNYYKTGEIDSNYDIKSVK